MLNKFTVAVKPLSVARRIAAAIRNNGNPEAAAKYLAGFEVRESIEIAAQDTVQKERI